MYIMNVHGKKSDSIYTQIMSTKTYKVKSKIYFQNMRL